eukprot:15440233-Alexandrium_andersonii.AAC.1
MLPYFCADVYNMKQVRAVGSGSGRVLHYPATSPPGILLGSDPEPLRGWGALVRMPWPTR